MIILNGKKSNNFFHEIQQKYENMLNNPYMECPICGSSKLIKWSSYQRTICFIDHDILQTVIIAIKRIRCKKCGHTHALLPSFIIPYKRSLLDVILNSFINKDITLTISYDVIIKWNKQFNTFLPYLKTLFKKSDKNSVIKIFLENKKEHTIFVHSL